MCIVSVTLRIREILAMKMSSARGFEHAYPFVEETNQDEQHSEQCYIFPFFMKARSLHSDYFY